jgi:hypothetical protein
MNTLNMTFSLNKKRSDYLVGGSQFAIGAFAFVYNLWRTFNAADARHRAGATASSARTMRTLDS